MADLVTIAHFPSAVSAEVARNVLANAGIQAVTNSALGLNAYYGNWMQGVELQVDEADAERAVYLLEAQEPLDEGEDIEGNIDDDMEFAKVEKEAPLPPMEFSSAGQKAADEPDDNPYASPAGVSVRTSKVEAADADDLDDSDHDAAEEKEDFEGDARRMFRGAVVSIFLPFIAPAITWQLIGRLDQYQHLSSEGKSRVVWAWVVSLPVTLFMIGGFLFFAYVAFGPR